MAVDGKWDVTANGPMGPQQITLTLSAEGSSLTGTMLSALRGEVVVTDGAVDGDIATWTAELTQPMPVSLQYAVTVKDDVMSGEVTVGNFGTFPLEGRRLA